MAIVNTLTKSNFIHEFNKCRPDNFTYDGLAALYDYFEQYSEDTGENIEFDPIAVCCEYTEYENLEEFKGDYNADVETIEDIRDYTTVIEIPNSDAFIIQSY
jgi:hypothetical protein